LCLNKYEELSGVYTTLERNEKCIQNFNGTVDRRVIVKWILKKWSDSMAQNGNQLWIFFLNCVLNLLAP
jgi:hypothetical protein